MEQPPEVLRIEVADLLKDFEKDHPRPGEPKRYRSLSER